MHFEWDDEKNRTNRAKHGISFEEAKHIFEGPVFSVVDDREDYGERREISIGRLSATSIVVVHTTRGGKIRLISARKANRQERQTYNDYIEETAQGN